MKSDRRSDPFAACWSRTSSNASNSIVFSASVRRIVCSQLPILVLALAFFAQDASATQHAALSCCSDADCERVGFLTPQWYCFGADCSSVQADKGSPKQGYCYCKPRQCNDACGVISDGCGGRIDCGRCGKRGAALSEVTGTSSSGTSGSSSSGTTGSVSSGSTGSSSSGTTGSVSSGTTGTTSTGTTDSASTTSGSTGSPSSAALSTGTPVASTAVGSGTTSSGSTGTAVDSTGSLPSVSAEPMTSGTPPTSTAGGAVTTGTSASTSSGTTGSSSSGTTGSTSSGTTGSSTSGTTGSTSSGTTGSSSSGTSGSASSGTTGSSSSGTTGSTSSGTTGSTSSGAPGVVATSSLEATESASANSGGVLTSGIAPTTSRRRIVRIDFSLRFDTTLSVFNRTLFLQLFSRELGVSLDRITIRGLRSGSVWVDVSLVQPGPNNAETTSAEDAVSLFHAKHAAGALSSLISAIGPILELTEPGYVLGGDDVASTAAVVPRTTSGVPRTTSAVARPTSAGGSATVALTTTGVRAAGSTSGVENIGGSGGEDAATPDAGLIVGIVIGVLALFALVVGGVLVWMRRRQMLRMLRRAQLNATDIGLKTGGSGTRRSEIEVRVVSGETDVNPLYRPD